MFCPHCGGKNNQEGLYCGQCGRELQEPAEPAAFLPGDGHSYCVSCGENNNAINLYCLQCGHSMDKHVTGDAAKNKTGPGMGVNLGQMAQNLKLDGGSVTNALEKGSWKKAITGAGVGAVAGIAASFILILIIVTAADFDLPFKINPVAVWVFSHFPAEHLGVAGNVEEYGLRVDGNAFIRLPFFILFFIPLLSVGIGSKVANQKISREDWLGRGQQGICTGVAYAFILLAVSLFARFDLTQMLPLGLFGLSNVDFGIHLQFNFFSVLLSGLVWGLAFGLLISVGGKLPRLVKHYAGERIGAAFSGVGRALLVTVVGGFILSFLGFIFLQGEFGYAEEALLVYALSIPNLLVYFAGVGAGADFRAVFDMGPESEAVFVSLLEHNQFFHPALYLLFLLVFVSLLWGGYRAQAKNGHAPFWSSGLLVGAGYSVVISLLSRAAQFRTEMDLGSLSGLMRLFDLDGGSAYLFAGTPWGDTLLGTLLIGAAAASLGAFLCSKKTG